MISSIDASSCVSTKTCSCCAMRTLAEFGASPAVESTSAVNVHCAAVSCHATHKARAWSCCMQHCAARLLPARPHTPTHVRCLCTSPLRVTTRTAWLTRLWHACASHATLPRRKARRLMLRGRAAHALLLLCPCLPVAHAHNCTSEHFSAKAESRREARREPRNKPSQNAAAMLAHMPHSRVFLAPLPRGSPPAQKVT